MDVNTHGTYIKKILKPRPFHSNYYNKKWTSTTLMGKTSTTYQEFIEREGSCPLSAEKVENLQCRTRTELASYHLPLIGYFDQWIKV